MNKTTKTRCLSIEHPINQTISLLSTPVRIIPYTLTYYHNTIVSSNLPERGSRVLSHATNSPFPPRYHLVDSGRKLQPNPYLSISTILLIMVLTLVPLSHKDGGTWCVRLVEWNWVDTGPGLGKTEVRGRDGGDSDDEDAGWVRIVMPRQKK